jgi:Mrp family chromosome partitioning ATPase
MDLRVSSKVDQMEGTIVELRRRKELEEANYRNYSATLEQARIDETLGNGRVSNIIQIQRPSPPFADRSKANKLFGMILGGGVLAGFAWAFFIELYFDRSIKRPVDVERALPAPLFISIPAVRASLLLNGKSNASNGAATNGIPPDAALTPLTAFHETLRDRLIGFFESINLNHKPKLVAVTGLSRKAGVSTTAAGLARSLSETGEGNVLLVDMNVDHGMAQQFNHGRACGIDDVLESRQNAQAEQNLYIVVENSQSDRLSRNMPQRFTKLVPKLKASDFDYIIFDMPPVSQISITPRLASFMDMVLLVVESGKTDRELVRRATQLLGESEVHVGVVLNKTRTYVPARLYQETLPN